MTGNDPYGSCYRAMRPAVLARNDGLCAFCGIQPATQTHHGMRDYPDHTDLREDQLVQLCDDCHDMATSIRKWCWRWNARPEVVYSVLRRFWERAYFRRALRRACGEEIRKVSVARQKEAAQRTMTVRDHGAAKTGNAGEAKQRTLSIRERQPIRTG